MNTPRFSHTPGKCTTTLKRHHIIKISTQKRPQSAGEVQHFHIKMDPKN